MEDVVRRQTHSLVKVPEHDSGTEYYVHMKIRYSDHDPSDFTEAQVTVVSSMEAKAWTFPGIKDAAEQFFNKTSFHTCESFYVVDLDEYALGSTIPNRMKHCLEALTDIMPPTEEYQARFTPSAGSSTLDVVVEWDARRHGKDYMYRIHFTATADSGPAVSEVLSASMDEYQELKEEAKTLQEEHERLRGNIQTNQKEIEQYVGAAQGHNADAAVKMGALLQVKDDERRLMCGLFLKVAITPIKATEFVQ